MSLNRPITAHDTMADLIRHDYNVLPVISRFRIPLGVGNKNIAQVCEQAGVNTRVFLMVINMMISSQVDISDMNEKDVAGIVDFLHNSHTYFIDYKFPHIRANLQNALDPSHIDINPAIMQFFDDYVEQVRIHFSYEENTVFPYVRALIHGDATDYSIDIFRKHHDEVAMKLTELKNIILLYYTTATPDKMYDALVDIFNCEADLESHALIENNILVPAIAAIERHRR